MSNKILTALLIVGGLATAGFGFAGDAIANGKKAKKTKKKPAAITCTTDDAPAICQMLEIMKAYKQANKGITKAKRIPIVDEDNLQYARSVVKDNADLDWNKELGTSLYWLALNEDRKFKFKKGQTPLDAMVDKLEKELPIVALRVQSQRDDQSAANLETFYRTLVAYMDKTGLDPVKTLAKPAELTLTDSQMVDLIRLVSGERTQEEHKQHIKQMKQSAEERFNQYKQDLQGADDRTELNQIMDDLFADSVIGRLKLNRTEIETAKIRADRTLNKYEKELYDIFKAFDKKERDKILSGILTANNPLEMEKKFNQLKLSDYDGVDASLYEQSVKWNDPSRLGKDGQELFELEKQVRAKMLDMYLADMEDVADIFFVLGLSKEDKRLESDLSAYVTKYRKLLGINYSEVTDAMATDKSSKLNSTELRVLKALTKYTQAIAELENAKSASSTVSADIEFTTDNFENATVVADRDRKQGIVNYDNEDSEVVAGFNYNADNLDINLAAGGNWRSTTNTTTGDLTPQTETHPDGTITLRPTRDEQTEKTEGHSYGGEARASAKTGKKGEFGWVPTASFGFETTTDSNDTEYHYDAEVDLDGIVLDTISESGNVELDIETLSFGGELAPIGFGTIMPNQDGKGWVVQIGNTSFVYTDVKIKGAINQERENAVVAMGALARFTGDNYTVELKLSHDLKEYNNGWHDISENDVPLQGYVLAGGHWDGTGFLLNAFTRGNLQNYGATVFSIDKSQWNDLLDAYRTRSNQSQALTGYGAETARLMAEHKFDDLAHTVDGWYAGLEARGVAKDFTISAYAGWTMPRVLGVRLSGEWELPDCNVSNIGLPSEAYEMALPINILGPLRMMPKYIYQEKDGKSDHIIGIILKGVF